MPTLLHKLVNNSACHYPQIKHISTIAGKHIGLRFIGPSPFCLSIRHPAEIVLMIVLQRDSFTAVALEDKGSK